MIERYGIKVVRKLINKYLIKNFKSCNTKPHDTKYPLDKVKNYKFSKLASLKRSPKMLNECYIATYLSTYIQTQSTINYQEMANHRCKLKKEI